MRKPSRTPWPTNELFRCFKRPPSLVFPEKHIRLLDIIDELDTDELIGKNPVQTFRVFVSFSWLECGTSKPGFTGCDARRPSLCRSSLRGWARLSSIACLSGQVIPCLHYAVPHQLGDVVKYTVKKLFVNRFSASCQPRGKSERTTILEVEPLESRLTTGKCHGEGSGTFFLAHP